MELGVEEGAYRTSTSSLVTLISWFVVRTRHPVSRGEAQNDQDICSGLEDPANGYFEVLSFFWGEVPNICA